jgi:hypothetical protein
MDILLFIVIMAAETQAKELRDVRRNFTCGQCATGPGSMTSTQRMTAVSTSSRLVSPSDSFAKPSRSGSLRTVDLSPTHQRATCRPTQQTSLSQGTHPAVPSTQPTRPPISASSGSVPQSINPNFSPRWEISRYWVCHDGKHIFMMQRQED